MNYDKVPEVPEVSVKPLHRRGGVWLAGALVLLAAGGAAWWLFGREPATLTAAAQHQAAQIAGLEQRLEKLRAELLALPEDAPLATQRTLLEDALARQNELLRLRVPPAQADLMRLSEWQARLDDLLAREKGRLSRELEAAAEALRSQQQPAAAVEKLQEALRLQREINVGMSVGVNKSYGREALLQQRIEELGAEPLLAEGRAALAAARAAAAGGSWAEALQLYGRAREIQQQLNTSYPRTRFSDLLADGRIEAEIASLSALEAQAQRDSFRQQAETAAAAGQLEAADRFYALAADRQQMINTQFAASRFASTEQLEEIEVERQTLRVRPLLAAAQELDRTAAAHLRRRELFQARQLAAQGVEKLAMATAQSPKARGIDEELRARLNYLGRRAEDWRAIQDQTYDQLLPLPGRASVALSKTAVSQTLFAVIMNTNPSRNAGRALPVDSASQVEAEEFCRRLGWVLGWPVRLPTAAERRAAAADPIFKAAAGGLGEWLAATGGDATVAPVFAADGVVREAPRTERSRTTGFRVIVEVDLLAGR